jgi:hypothetical protein
MTLGPIVATVSGSTAAWTASGTWCRALGRPGSQSTVGGTDAGRVLLPNQSGWASAIFGQPALATGLGRGEIIYNVSSLDLEEQVETTRPTVLVARLISNRSGRRSSGQKLAGSAMNRPGDLGDSDHCIPAGATGALC